MKWSMKGEMKWGKDANPYNKEAAISKRLAVQLEKWLRCFTGHHNFLSTSVTADHDGRVASAVQVWGSWWPNADIIANDLTRLLQPLWNAVGCISRSPPSLHLTLCPCPPPICETQIHSNAALIWVIIYPPPLLTPSPRQPRCDREPCDSPGPHHFPLPCGLVHLSQRLLPWTPWLAVLEVCLPRDFKLIFPLPNSRLNLSTFIACPPLLCEWEWSQNIHLRSKGESQETQLVFSIMQTSNWTVTATTFCHRLYWAEC